MSPTIRKENETRVEDNTFADSAGPPESPKTRRCLRCQTTFASAWAGERVCPRCKGSQAWRNGMPLNKAKSASQR